MIANLAGRPIAFMMALSFINYLGFAGWSALLYNFTVERAAFDWADTGLTQSVREIPGFLAFTAIFWLAFMREQVLAYAALFILGLGVALTGQFPTLTGVLITTFIMSVGFHYFETANASLQLQLLPKAEAPRLMGIHSRGGRGGLVRGLRRAGARLVAGWRSYEQLYLVLGLACAALVIAAMAFFRRFEGPVPQKKHIVLKRRYWLYYALTFMTGARRQLFFAFGGFLLVKKFGYSVADMAMLMLVTTLLNTALAPRLGALVMRAGERRTIMLENIVLILVFAGYATTSSWQVAGRPVRDRRHLLHADPGAAHLLPEDRRPRRHGLHHVGRLHHQPHRRRRRARRLRRARHDRSRHHLLDGGCVATVSLSLSFLVPRHPALGNETVLAVPKPLPAE